MKSDIERFLHIIENSASGLSYINISAACIRVKDQWAILGASITLDTQETTPNKEFQEVPIKMFYVSRPITEARKIIEEVEQGILAIDGKDLVFGRNDDSQLRNFSDHLQFYGFRSDIFRKGDYYLSGFPKCCLFSHRESISNLCRLIDQKYETHIDESLQKSETPFLNIEDFLTETFYLNPFGFTKASGCFVYITAPIFVALKGPVILSKGALSINLQISRSWDPNGISIGIILRSREDVSAQRYSLSWKQLKEFIHEKSTENFSIKIPTNSTYKATAILRYNGLPIDQRTELDYSILEGNAYLKVMRLFGINSVIFDKYLIGEGQDKAKDFEKGVAFLLHAAGFNTGHYGGIPSMDDGEIDIVAFCPNTNKILSIECTLKDINKKLSSLSRRAKNIREQLPNYEVIAAVATTLTFGKIHKPDIEEAISENISILTIEELKKISEMANGAEGPIAVCDFIQKVNSVAKANRAFYRE